MKKRSNKSTYLMVGKKGLSTIVITILVVSLALVAIGIVWQIISGILESSEEDTEFSQSRINMRLSSVFVEGSYVSLKVSRLTGPGDMRRVKFIFSDGRRSESVENTTSLEELEEKTFLLVLTSLDYSELKTISVAPMIRLSSGEIRIGNILDTYTIRAGNYNQSRKELDGQICNELISCPGDIEGSSECDALTGNIIIYWTVFTCVFGSCITDEVLRLTELCSNGCDVQTATCVAPPECVLPSNCGVDGPVGLTFCENISEDIYQNYINYSCNLGSCSNAITEQRVQSCDGLGCFIGEIEAECNPGLGCVVDSDCDPDGFITDSEQCIGNEVWIDWQDNFCSNNNCINNVIQVLKEDCSTKPGTWSCIQGECIE